MAEVWPADGPVVARQLDSPFVTARGGDFVAPALLAGLVDDAGLFPPTGLAMGEALARHAADLSDPTGVLSHRFICPAGRLDELAAALGGPITVSVITGISRAGLEELDRQLARDPRLELVGLEGLPAGELGEVEAPVPVFVELPVKKDWRPLLDEVAAAGLGAKVRCGGLEAGLFPTTEELGGFIAACASAGVSFKATAGLHHALPYLDEETGFSHHGFANLLLAACRATDGGAATDVVAALGLREASRLTDELLSVGPELAARARRLFVSYGSCSTSEPIEDLEQLGLLPKGAVSR